MVDWVDSNKQYCKGSELLMSLLCFCICLSAFEQFIRDVEKFSGTLVVQNEWNGNTVNTVELGLNELHRKF